MQIRKWVNRLVPGAVGLLIISAVSYKVWQSQPGYTIEPGYHAVEAAFHAGRSNLMVEVSGSVVRLLSDTHENPPHQQFVIQLINGQRVQVMHDLASSERVPVAINHKVTVRGEYEWTELGGVIHWTRSDPSTQRRHGWILHEGQRYN